MNLENYKKWGAVMRLIDADLFKSYFRADTVTGTTIHRMIDEQSTAYDVDNIIKQLKENEQDLIKSIREVSPSGRYTASADELKSLIEEYTKEQIKIVKSGGAQNGN